MLDYFYLTVFKIFVLTIKYTPTFITNAVLNCLAKIAYMLDKKHRKIARVNLDLAYEDSMSEEEKTRIIKKCYKNLLYNLRDFVENQNITGEQLLNKVNVHNKDKYLQAKNSGKNIIFITAHYGNWELLPLFVGASLGTLWGVGRKLDSPRMNQILQNNREQFNVHMLEKQGAMKGLLRAIKNKENIGLLVDQNTSEKDGILIEFFGKLARHTPSATLIARKTGAIIVPAFITTNDYKTYDITFYDPIVTKRTADIDEDIRQSVQAQADVTQKAIEKKPDEWFWLHRRWKNQYEELYK
ncbi:MAG: lipid A biosynthesis lauroyl acyltransferase [Sulfurospirillaceae bacterium]|nr:lipid A biosynthesis lauroyl acyltransferase [Sulfurospirillaceae bacterium]